MVKKRNLFEELSEATDDIRAHKKKKITLRQYDVKKREGTDAPISPNTGNVGAGPCKTK